MAPIGPRPPAAPSGVVVVTSEDRWVNPAYIVAVVVRPLDDGGFVVELELADGTTLTRGCHHSRESAEWQRGELLHALRWCAV